MEGLEPEVLCIVFMEPVFNHMRSEAIEDFKQEHDTVGFIL